MFRVELYEDERGNKPIVEFLDSLSPKMAAKLISLLEVLEEKGNYLREPYSKSLGDGIFELRCNIGNDISRILYFFYKGKIVVVTNGFIKKTQKTPPAEIELAKKRRTDWLRRNDIKK